MKLRLAYPVMTVLSATVALLSLHPGAEAAPAERTALDCAAPREPAPVAEDPQRPLDPQFAQKVAQRYRQWGVQGGARS